MHAPTTRDTRIDVFRAVALLTIFVNHVPGTVFEHMTHKNFGFSDAAEAFVLISGISVGLAYGSKFKPGARLLTTIKAWRRAGVLYVAQIMTTIATLALFSAAAIYFHRPGLLKLINIEPVMKQTPESLIGIATLGHQLGYNNILSTYAAMILMLPGLLLLGGLSLRLMVSVSGLIWLGAGIFQIAPPNYPADGYWFLNPLSWQFLFTIGVAATLHVKRGGRIAFNPGLAFAAASYLVLALLWVKIPLWGIDISLGLPPVLTGFDKTFLSVSRLLHILAAAYLIVSIPAIANLARTSMDNPLAILGRHSLPVFLAGTMLAMAAQVAKAVSPGGIWFDATLIATGVALQFALAWYLEWLRDLGKRRAQPAISSLSPPVALPRPAP